MARDTFQVITDTDTDDFYIVMPDEGETDDWTEADDVAIFVYAGRTYLCAGPVSDVAVNGNVPPLVVIGTGGQFKTEQVEWEGDTEGEGGDTDVPVDEDEDEELDELEESEAALPEGEDSDDDDDDDDDNAEDEGIL